MSVQEVVRIIYAVVFMAILLFMIFFIMKVRKKDE
jgi:hypothetical protein